MRAAHVAALLAGAALIPSALAAQSGDRLAERLARESARTVSFHFEVAPDVTVCDRGFHRRSDGPGTVRWDSRGQEESCPGGPLEVVVERRGDRVVEIDFGAVDARRANADLGRIDPAEAADWLLSLADRDADTDAAEDALAGATVARGVQPAPRLLDLARDRAVHRDIRRNALFWVSQIAADGIDESLVGIAADAADDQEVRDMAVFALSQRPDEQAVPALMDLVRTAPHAQTRRSALFWLAQSDDTRVPDFFAALITGSGG